MTEHNAHTWLLLNSGLHDGPFNMGLDEALLEAMPRLGQPLLRFYGWTQPAASFGYFQKYAEVEREISLRPLVRRPTAGGIALHDHDWTYSLVFPVDHEWYSLRAVESYQRLHEWLQAAFGRVGIATELADCSRRAETGGQCFAGYERFDLLWHGQKIAGAAQRRRRDGLLIQGSIQPPPSCPPRASWHRAMCEAGGQGIRWVEFALDAAIKERATALGREKYSQPVYNWRR